MQDRSAVYGSVIALQGKAFNEPRIIVIATGQLLNETQFTQVVKANVEKTQTLNG